MKLIFNILFQIGIIKIDFTTVISFLIGVFMGFIILLLVYALLVVSSMKTKNFFAKTDQDDLTTEEIKDMVQNTQITYKDKNLRGELSRIPFCYKLCKDLAYGIAARYYPKSNHPLLELSINEITMLTGYITSRVDEILNHRGVRMLRKLKISTIVDISSKKKDIEESKAFQATMAISQNLNKFKYVLNIINPVNWGRKLVVDRILNIVIDQICLVTISIVAEETYKIYSKKVFNKDVEIDTGADKLIEEMSDTIKDAAMDIESDYPKIVKSNYTDSKTIKLKGKMLTGKSINIIKAYDAQMPLKTIQEGDTINEKEN